jgi:hypothetical protein
MAVIDTFLRAMGMGIIEQVEKLEQQLPEGEDNDQTLALRDYFSQLLAVADHVDPNEDRVRDWLNPNLTVGIDVCECEQFNAVPGVRYPVEVGNDTTRPWIERCDQCKKYPGDWEAAEALVAAGEILGFRSARIPGTQTDYPYAIPKED